MARSHVLEMRSGDPRTPNPQCPRSAIPAAHKPVAAAHHLELHPEAGSLGKARPSPLIAYREKPAPAQPAHTGIRKWNPYPAQAKAHRAPVTHRTCSLSLALLSPTPESFLNPSTHAMPV